MPLATFFDFLPGPALAEVSLVSGAVLLALFTALWGWCLSVRNASWVDVAWAFGMLVPAALALGWQSPGLVDWILLALLAGWSLRLGSHLASRVARHHPEEDSRYASLRQRWGNDPLRWWVVFALQVAVILILALPVLIVLVSPNPAFGLWQVLGILVVLAGIGGEALADRQLARFLSRPKNERDDPVCREGLWGWSRHPNYFFEHLSWWGFFLFAQNGEPERLLTVVSPLAMLGLLLFVTGVPPAERSSLRSKPEAYPRYQKEVSRFVPLPPRDGSGLK